MTRDDVLTQMLYRMSDQMQPRELRSDSHPQESVAGDDWKFRETRTMAEWQGASEQQRKRQQFFRYVR